MPVLARTMDTERPVDGTRRDTGRLCTHRREGGTTRCEKERAILEPQKLVPTGRQPRFYVVLRDETQNHVVEPE